MLAKLFKAFVGDKSAKDIQEVQPIVDRVKVSSKMGSTTEVFSGQHLLDGRLGVVDERVFGGFGGIVHGLVCVSYVV